MSFVITIEAPTEKARGEVQALGKDLDTAEVKGKRVGAAITAGAREGAASTDRLRDSTGRFLSAAERAAAATERMGQAGHVLAQSFGGVTVALQREQAMLESIHGPMQRFQQDMQTLEMLNRRGALSADQHAAALARVRSAAGAGNPMDAVSLGRPGEGPKQRDHMAGQGAAMMGVGIAGFAAKQVLDLSDSYTNLQNRLRGVSTSQANLNVLMEATRGVADRTRSDWGATAESYVRLTNATKQLGLTQERGLAITETLNMALQSSGASSAEASAGTLQLMQALSAGALQGDEFRSISESLPDLMDVFAKQLGVTRGELKKMGAEGKITTDVVIKGLEAASGTIHDRFNASTATASQLWTVFKNQMTETAGTFVQSTGVLSILGDVLGGVSMAMKFFGEATGVVRGALEKLGPVGDVIKTALGMVVSPMTTTVKVIDALDAGMYELAKEADAAQKQFKALDPTLDLAAQKFRIANDPVIALTRSLQAQHDKLNTNKLSFDAITPSIDAVSAAMQRLGLVTDAWSNTSAFGGFDAFAAKFKKELEARGAILDGLRGGRVKYHEELDLLNKMRAEGPANGGIDETEFQRRFAELNKGDKAKRGAKGKDPYAIGMDLGGAGSALDGFVKSADWRSELFGPKTGGSLSGGAIGRGIPVIDLSMESKAEQQERLNAAVLEHTRMLPELEKQYEEFQKTATGSVARVSTAWKELGEESIDRLKESVYSLGDAFVDTFTQADFSWQKFLSSLAAGMAKDSIRMWLKFGMKALEAYSDGGGWSPAAAGGGLADGEYGDLRIPGAAHGGSWTVGGSGGTDSKLAMLRVTPGEQLSVNTPEQVEKRGGGTTRKIINLKLGRSGVVTHDDLEGLVIKVVDRQLPSIRSRITGY